MARNIRLADPDSAPDDRGPGVGIYLRILGYFRPDLALIISLVVLIWLSLAAGVLEGAVVLVLTDAILSAREPATWLGRLVLSIVPDDRTSHPLGWLGRAVLSILPADRPGRVVGLALLWLLTRVANDTLLLLREMINNKLRYNGTARVRRHLFDHLQTLSPSYHKSQPQGDALYRLSTDAQGFFGVLDTLVGAANSVVTVFVIGSVMAGFNITITVVCLALAPLLVLGNLYFSRTIRRTSGRSKQADTELLTFVQRAMATVSLAQLFGRQETQSARFGQTVDRSVEQGMRMSWQVQLFPWSQRILYAVGHAFVLGYGGWLVFTRQPGAAGQPMTVGAVTAMLVYLGQLWEPVRRMAGFTAEVQNNLAACARVFAVLDLTPTVVDPPDAKELEVRPRVLELEAVWFDYGNGRPVLRGVDARIEPGQMVAFVGPSGSGKSTLLNLLPRFYDPTGGRITLDGHDLRTLRLTDVRGHVALVPQDSPVMAGSVADNIAFGRPDATPEQIRRAAEMAGARSFIEELPFLYDTVVTEAGQNLSGGQRQRLAIARALLTEAPILILDEPTSGLDRHHERLVLDTLQRLKGTRTIVLVTHNLSAAAECDRVFAFGGGQNGTGTEQATDEDLLPTLGAAREAVNRTHARSKVRGARAFFRRP